MNWDWDKLQEKRQRQQGGNPPPRPQRETESEDEGQERQQAPRAKRSPFNRPGGGDDNPLKKLSQLRLPNGKGFDIYPGDFLGYVGKKEWAVHNLAYDDKKNQFHARIGVTDIKKDG